MDESTLEDLRKIWWDEKKDLSMFSIGDEPASGFNPSQDLFFNDRSSYSIMLSGAFRSGKTDIMLRKCVLLSLIFPGNEGLLGRKTSTEVEVTTLPHLREICDPRLFSYHPKQGVLEFYNGSKMYLRGLDVLQGGGEMDTKKAIEFIRGLNLGWWAIDQAEGVEKIIVDHLEARLSRNNVPFRQAMLTCNPTNFWGWEAYKENPEEGYRLIEVSMIENAANLPKEYLEKHLQMKVTRPRYYKQYVEGVWDEFMSSSDTVLEPASLEKLQDQVTEPAREYKGFLIYKEPNDRHFYQIGVDPSEGQHDRGAIAVFDTLSGELVASYAKKVMYDILAQKTADIAQLYRNIKRVIPESNNHALIMELQNFPHLRLYKDETLGKEEVKEKDMYGFRMTRDKKRFLVDSFEELLAEGKVVVYDKETVREFATFSHNGLKMEAMSGKYDDRVIACLLGCMGLKPTSGADIPTFHKGNDTMINNFFNSKPEQPKITHSTPI